MVSFSSCRLDCRTFNILKLYNCIVVSILIVIVYNCVSICIASYTCIPIVYLDPLSVLSEQYIASGPHHAGSIMNEVVLLEITALSHFGIAPLVLNKSLMQLIMVETLAVYSLGRSI